MFKFQKVYNKVFISLFGIKIRFKTPNCHKNMLIIIDKHGNKKRLYKCPKDINVIFTGENSLVELFADNTKLYRNLKIVIGSNASVKIETPNNSIGINNLFLEVFDKCNVFIKEGFSCVKGKLLAVGYDNKIEIGEDSMFGKNFVIRTDDGHTMLDISSRRGINKPKDVILGNHVWLTDDVSILKGVHLENNVIVGTKSVVTKSVEGSNIVLAGNPARIIKQGVTWDRENFISYSYRNGEV